MNSLDIKFLQKLRYNENHISSLQRLGEYKGKQSLFFQQTPEVLKALQQTAIIESSESSNRLEGITAPHKRVEAIVLQSTKPKNRSEQEIAGYRDILALIHESGKDMPFTKNVILQCHSMLYRYMPNQGGRWKMTNNDIVEKDKDGNITRVRFKPVSAVQTPHATGQSRYIFKHFLLILI